MKRFDLLPASFAFSNFLLDHAALHAAMRADLELQRTTEKPVRNASSQDIESIDPPRNRLANLR
jgi:hypothetical protein